MATTEGSCSTIPLPDTYTSVLAVPRSIPMSRDKEKRLKRPTVVYAPTIQIFLTMFDRSLT